MQSGTTGMNTIRIYNPIKQGYDQDPEGVFIRCWVPELNTIPDAYVHEPWLCPYKGAGYPDPIVDVAVAARQARDRVWAVRRGDQFDREAGKIIHKHASRKDAAGHFINDRSQRPRRKPAKDDRQGSFGF